MKELFGSIGLIKRGVKHLGEKVAGTHKYPRTPSHVKHTTIKVVEHRKEIKSCVSFIQLSLSSINPVLQVFAHTLTHLYSDCG